MARRKGKTKRKAPSSKKKRLKRERRRPSKGFFSWVAEALDTRYENLTYYGDDPDNEPELMRLDKIAKELRRLR